MHSNTGSKEINKLLHSYQDELVKLYDKHVKDGKKAHEGKGRIRIRISDDEKLVGDYLNYESDFGSLLYELELADKKEKERLERISGHTDDKSDAFTIDFGYLLISLSRTIPLVERIVKRICDMNIGDAIVSGENFIPAMHSALVWLYLQSTDVRDVTYQDMGRLRRFLKYQIARFKENHDLAYSPSSIQEKYETVCEDLFTSTREEKIEFLAGYRREVGNLLEHTFDVFKRLYIFYQYMKEVDRGSYELDKKMDVLSAEYKKIYNLAVNIQNIILRRFASFVKISDLNFPHGSFMHGDFVSSTLSNSNLTNSDFRYCDFSDAVLRNCDMSVSDLTFTKNTNADYSNSNLNASNLVGADFSDATLNNVQLMNALFRNRQIDFDISYYTKAYFQKDRSKYHDALALVAERDSLRSEQESSVRGLTAELRGSFFERLKRPAQHFENSEFTEESLCSTVRKNDRSTHAKDSMDGLWKLFQDSLVPLRTRMANYTLRPELLKQIEKIYQNETMKVRLDNQNKTKCVAANPHTVCFFRASMDKVYMPRADLSHVDLSSVSLVGADISDGDFFYTSWNGAALAEANLSSARMYYTNLSNANLNKANLIGAVCYNTDFGGVNFSESLLIDAIFLFVDANIPDPYVKHIFTQTKENLVEGVSDFTMQPGKTINNCNFNRSNCMGMILAGAQADRTTWLRAELKSALLINVLARWAQMDRADLSYSIIAGATFHQTSFTDAILSNSRMYACDMMGTRLRNANFIASRLDKVIFQNADLSGTNFTGADINNCVFNDVNFDHANISGVVFKNCVFKNIDFSHCIGLTTACFKHCYFDESCSTLQYEIGNDGKADKEYMSIPHQGKRVKFFRDEDQDYRDSFGSRQYTSLSYYLLEE